MTPEHSQPSLLVVDVPPDEVFAGIDQSFAFFRSLLSRFSRGDGLFCCARLNLILSNPNYSDELEKQRYGIDFLEFSREERDRLNAFAERHGGPSQVRVFFRAQLLEMVRWVSLYSEDYPNDGDTLLEAPSLLAFRQALLIAGHQWLQRVVGDRFAPGPPLAERRERALPAMRVIQALNSTGPDPLMSLGRGKGLMDRMVAADSQFNDEFNAATGLSLDEYYVCWCALMTHVFDINPDDARRSNDHCGIFNENTYARDRPFLGTFLQLESQSPDELRDACWGTNRPSSFEEAGHLSARAIRLRPILHLADGRAIVLDPVFCSEKVAIGPIFAVTGSAERERGNAVLTTFGEVFEEYVRRTLQSMYPAASGLADRLVSPLGGRNGAGTTVQITDACLNDVTEAVFMEIKAVWIRENLLLEPESYLAQLRKQYGTSVDANGITKRKGATQLAHAIRQVATGKWVTDETAMSKVQQILPVLLVHDNFLDSPAHGHFLDGEFRRELNAEEASGGYLRVGNLSVAPLTVMSIEDFQVLETSIREFSLFQLLRDYSERSPDRLLSLHNFLASSEYSDRLHASTTVASRTLEVLRSAMQILFPNSPHQP